MKNKILILVGSVFLASLILFVLQACLVSAEEIRLSLVNYEPRPVVPGSFFTASFLAENIAGQNLTDIVFELKDKDPFFVEGSDERDFSLIPAGSGVEFSFMLGVESDAKSGFEKVKLEYETATDDGEETFSVQVRAIETTLVVTAVESNPENLGLGEEAEVSIRLGNKADFSLKDISIKLDLSSAELPFAPLGSVTERKIESLSSGSELKVNFKIITLANAVAGIYKVPLSIAYFDEFGKIYEKNDIISLIVGGTPDVSVRLDESKLVVGREGEVTIELVNQGLSDMKFLNVRLLPSSTGSYEILSADSIYVGSLDSDDSETLNFNIRSQGEGFVELILLLNYKDERNNDYTKTESLNAQVYSLGEAKQIGLVKTSRTSMIVGIFVLFVVGYFFYRRRKRLRSRV